MIHLYGRSLLFSLIVIVNCFTILLLHTHLYYLSLVSEFWNVSVLMKWSSINLPPLTLMWGCDDDVLFLFRPFERNILLLVYGRASFWGVRFHGQPGLLQPWKKSEVGVPLFLSDKRRIWASIVILISLSLRLYSQRELVWFGLVWFWLVSLSGRSRAGDDFVVFVWKNQPPISVSLFLFFYVYVHCMCIYICIYIFFFFFFLSMLWWLFLASNWT